MTDKIKLKNRRVQIALSDNSDDWDKLSEAQKQGILDAIDEIEDGKGIPNEVVFEKVRRKYSHE